MRFGIGRGIGVGEGAGAVAPIGMRGGCLAPLPGRSPQLMAAIDGYAQKPCFQMLAVDEVRPIIEKGEKHVLGNVFRILRGTCLVECQSIDGAAVIVHRLLHERCRPWSARGMVVGSRAGGCWSRGALARAADLRGRGRRGWLFLRICAADGGLVLCHFFTSSHPNMRKAGGLFPEWQDAARKVRRRARRGVRGLALRWVGRGAFRVPYRAEFATPRTFRAGCSASRVLRVAFAVCCVCFACCFCRAHAASHLAWRMFHVKHSILWFDAFWRR